MRKSLGLPIPVFQDENYMFINDLLSYEDVLKDPRKLEKFNWVTQEGGAALVAGIIDRTGNSGVLTFANDPPTLNDVFNLPAYRSRIDRKSQRGN